MKQFFIKIFYFAAFPISILLILLILHLKSPLMSDYDYDGGMKLKHLLLKRNINEKKIIFIGGSNLSMGTNSSTIQSSFPDFQIINYGHRFQYGLDFYTSEISKYLKKDDIVVIVPEYQLILDDYFGNHQLVKAQIENLKFSNFKIDLAPKDILSYTQERFDFLYKLHIGAFPSQENINRITAFNKFGDCNAHWFWSEVEHENYQDPVDIKLIDNEILKIFIETYSQKGINFILVPPMYERKSYYLCKNLIEDNKKFYESVGLSFAYPTDKMILDSKYFYDTPYHLLNDGVKIKTAKIISILTKNINDRMQIAK